MISAAASSCRAETGANTLVTATPSACRQPGRGTAHRVGVERGQFPAVELDAAVHDRGADGDLGGEITRPVEDGPDAVGGRPADPDRRDPPQALALEHGVGRVRGPEHDVADPARLDGGRGQHRSDGGGDPAGDVRRGRHLGRDDQPVRRVHDHRVGVGAADVDPQPPVNRGHRRVPLPARSRSRSRTPAARSAASPWPSATPGRRRTRSPIPAGRSGSARSRSPRPSRCRAR